MTKPDKITRKKTAQYELYVEKDGTKTFRGKGEEMGSVIVPAEYNVKNIVTYVKRPRRTAKKPFLDCLWAAKERMPQRPITLSDVADYKEECRCFLEALREGRAQFFRDIGDMIKRGGKLSEIEIFKTRNQQAEDDKILNSISVAFSILGTPPKFKTLLEEAQKITGLGNKLTAQKLKKRLKCYGFEWLGKC